MKAKKFTDVHIKLLQLFICDFEIFTFRVSLTTPFKDAVRRRCLSSIFYSVPHQFASQLPLNFIINEAI